jgi:HD-GYP domain-containing protein (c-di-GMP phosphodiesterase class II)
VVYDVQFTEPSRPDDDWALYRAVQRFPGTILAATETDDNGRTRVLGGEKNLAKAHATAAAANVPTLSGGYIARVPADWQGLPTIAVAAARSVGHPVNPAAFGRDGALIAFRGPPGTIPTVSFVDLLRGDVDPAVVRDRIVIVGATAPTLQDIHPTPTSGDGLMAGAEVQANAIWTVLHDVPLRSPPPGIIVALILLAALSAAMVRLGESAAVVALAGSLVTAIFLVGVQLAFDAGIVVPVVGTLGALLTSAAAAILANHLLMTRELHATQLEIVQRLGRAAESSDGATGRHLERIGFLCERLALAAGLSRREAKLLRQASALHDVGKIGIPDHVLLKTGPFDDVDRAIMSTHTARGARLLAGSSTSLVQMAEIIALTHHERWDGTGYPAGLAGEEIPLPGRICAICDVFDALVSKRPYKEAWTVEAALAEIEREAGAHFDPRLAALFLRIAPRLYDELADQPHDDMTGLHPEMAPFADPASFREVAGSEGAASPVTAA